MPYSMRGEDRDRDQRGAMRDEEQGYQDVRDQRERDIGRTDDRNDRRIDQRFDYGGEDRSRDRSWSNTSDPFSERDRYRQGNDMYGNRPGEFDRMRGGYAESSRGGYRDQEYGFRERSDRGVGREFGTGGPGRGYPGQGGGYSGQGGQGGYSGQGGGYYGQGGGYYGQGGGYYGQGGGYSQGGGYYGQGGQSGSQAGDMSSRTRGQHHGKGPSGYQRSDERIKEMVSEALADHDDIDATNIEVNVKGGEVTLTGTVEDRRMKRLAEECVESVRGVKDVQNQLRVATDRKSGAQTGSPATDKTDKNDAADKRHRPS